VGRCSQFDLRLLLDTNRTLSSTERCRVEEIPLALGALPDCTDAAGSMDTSALVAGFGPPESVNTSPEMAVLGVHQGCALLNRRRPGARAKLTG
jgi:hypothetical protein